MQAQGRIIAATVMHCILLGCSSCLEISKLEFPHAIEANSVQLIVLDCDYNISDAETPGLTVKWYFDSDPSPIYQWIPNHPPQAFGKFRENINLKFRASEENAKMYRAIQFNNLVKEMTGNYTCQVATFEEEKSMSKMMIVYNPPDTLELSFLPASGFRNVTCAATNVFPQPELQLYSMNDRRSNWDVYSDLTFSDGFYNVSAFAEVPEEFFKEDDIFECVLTIPGTPYNDTSTSKYSSGCGAKEEFSWCIPICSLLLLQKIGTSS